MEKAMAPTPVTLPGKSHGWRSLVSCSPWGCEESDTTEQLHFHAPEKEMATHSSMLAWKIPWMEEPGGLQSMGSLGVGHDGDFTFTFHFHALEKEMAAHSSILAWRIPGTGAWWAVVYGVTQSWTQLKRLSSSRHLGIHA